MSQPAPPPGQPYQPQHGQPMYYGEPPKEKHTLRNVLLILGVLGVLFCGGCLAVTGIFINEVDESIEEEVKNDTPTEVTVGEAFIHDEYEVAAGWEVKKDGPFDGFTIEAKVTNRSDDRRSALLDFTFLKGTEVLDEVICSTQELGTDESSDLDCLGTTEKIDGYDTVKVADSF